jgi:signal transduction histidine kinase
MDGLGRNAFTAVIPGPAYAATLRLALSLHPETQQVFVVARTRNDALMSAVRTELRPVAQQVKVIYLDAPTVPRLLVDIEAAPRRSLVLYIWHSETAEGTSADDSDTVRLVSRVSPVPVYGTSDLSVGSGVVGGVVRGTRATGVRLAAMVGAIIAGTPPEHIPLETTRLVPTFDWRQLRRWDIDPSRLPADADVRFRTPTAWDAYREFIIAVAAVVLAQLLLIGALLAQRARRQEAETLVRTREATLRGSYLRIRQLTGRLITAQEAARADVARELHDDVCQQLVGVSIAVSTLKRANTSMQDPETQQLLASVQQAALGVVNGVRRLSHDLHPGSLRLVGLGPALMAHCREVEQRYDVQVSFERHGELGYVEPDVALCLFRIAQEALRNGAVHGVARRLTVSLSRPPASIELTVSDDGCGFDLRAIRNDSSGLGLISMEERAHLVGGVVQITSRPGHGTTVRACIPAVAIELQRRDDVAATMRLGVGRPVQV